MRLVRHVRDDFDWRPWRFWLPFKMISLMIILIALGAIILISPIEALIGWFLR